MIIRQLLAWTQHSSAARRAEAAGALARAHLYGGVAPDQAWQAEAALLALLDDPASLVRRALAEACAGCATAPRPLIVALAGDQPDIAALVLARSPVLTDADLVDGVAIGCLVTRSAIARRPDLSPAVAGAMAEIGEAAALVVLARNRSAHITTGSLMRMIARHGDDAALREAVLARPNLPLEVRQSVTTQLAESLSAFAVAAGWLTPARSARASREAQERATLAFSAQAHPVDLARLVVHLKAHGQLNAGLLLRAILSGHMAFAEAALADLSGLGAARVAGLMAETSSAAFAALHRKAGLPQVLLPAFTAALSAWREAGRGASTATGAGLSRLMIERALTACEAMPFSEAQGVMALLTRFEAEAARDEARVLARDLAEEALRLEAQRVEAEILDAEWREAQQRVVHAAAPLALPEATAFESTETSPAVAGPDPAIPEAQAPEPAEPITMRADIRDPAPPEEIVASQPDDAAPPIPGEIVDLARTDPVGAILDALPDAILAEFRRAGVPARTRSADDAVRVGGEALAETEAPTENAACDHAPLALAA